MPPSGLSSTPTGGVEVVLGCRPCPSVWKEDLVSRRQLVALGSSFAAGPGIAPVVDRTARRSGRNYPNLVAETLGADLIDVTVSGATTATILDTAQRTPGRTHPPQIEAVHADTDLVTVTAGGNDLGYIGAILGGAVRQRLLDSRLARPLARAVWPDRPLALPSTEQVAAATSGLVRIVEEVRARAPRARVVLVDYLPVFDEAPRTATRHELDPDQVQHHRRVADVLSEVFATAGARSGAVVVGADSYEPRHGVGSVQPWINDVVLRRLVASFHPNAAGMRAVADAVLDVV